MVATTFAADTPLAVTELVAKYGISGNWLWWYMGISSIVTVFFFSFLWKKSGVLTDVELVELRYGDRGGRILRGFKSIYLGAILNILILAWVNLAMLKIAEVLFPGYSAKWIVALLFLFAFFYTTQMGLIGISFADTFQFFFAMAGCVILAVFVLQLPGIGGLSGLKSQLKPGMIQFIPGFSGENSPFGLDTFLIFITVVWWSSWYPGAEPGGGGYIAQRILAAKDVNSSIMASLWFTIAHYFIRPWPWIIVALVSLLIYPDLPEVDKSKGFVLLMKNALPEGLFGVLVAGFLAAYLSTIATHLNWGSSYLINDLYRPFVRKNKEDSHYLHVSTVSQLLMMIVSLVITFYFIDTISGVWRFILEAGAGTGFALIVRWYWPKMNSYGELSGFILPGFFYSMNHFFIQIPTPYSILFIVFSTILVQVLIIHLTPQTETSILKRFYERVNPPGYFWKVWCKTNQIDFVPPYLTIVQSTILSILGLVFIYSSLFSVGYLLFLDYTSLVLTLPLAGGSVYGIWYYFPKTIQD